MHVYTCDRQSATGRQSSSSSSSTCPTSHVSITRTEIAKHCISARLTLINHCHTTASPSSALHMCTEMNHARRAGTGHTSRSRARTRIARARLAKPVQSITKCSGQWRGSEACSRKKKYLQQRRRGGSIGCYCCRCFSRHGISVLSLAYFVNTEPFNVASVSAVVPK